MFEPVRGGTRGGQAEFKWSDVSADKDRENYLGHSINAPTGRWQKNKDIHWYNREKQQTEDERQAEIQKVKQLEAEAIAAALGFQPTTKPGEGASAATGANATAGPTAAPAKDEKTEEERLKEKEEKKRRKAERKEEKARRKEEKRARRREREGRGRDYDDEEDRRSRRRHSRSRSPRRRSASPRRGSDSGRRRTESPHRHRDRDDRDYEARERDRYRSRSPTRYDRRH
ncbi:hypothetical protein CC1G_10929 [Coprinopsis cinerea okayama7|uniref:Multiple myeloma tumor-associated protein 2-like N-terminal domain-containing protein n=1 Tax=Coprinopsis cinerea (strain Okayama-7 / 130 / ATCC MYA-4618 / FGSC 9003) TaxID=240176 RepID=A8NT35_COPC7|nr:hypothetical protein CC1G_10929 [Coprinopsis cinerea okayama7\|eukprot:XP_001836148.2 hypothetical protein CC1G_10929 [Coprinopsis cinerea okayama7\